MSRIADQLWEERTADFGEKEYKPLPEKTLKQKVEVNSTFVGKDGKEHSVRTTSTRTKDYDIESLDYNGYSHGA